MDAHSERIGMLPSSNCALHSVSPLAAGLLCSAVGALLCGSSAIAQDFNGDGLEDVAIGSPSDFLGAAAAGSVTIIYGSGPGLGLSAFGPVPSQIIAQGPSGIELDEVGDRFGSALAWGDFNGDAFDDLVIGIPGEDFGGVVDCGAFAVVYGSPAGLVTIPPAFAIQPGAPFPDPAEMSDEFGSALAVADFNADGFDDLVVGTPFEDVGALVDAGIIQVFHGFPGGILGGPMPPMGLMDQGAISTDPTEAGDRFGTSLAAADFDASGTADLAIGVPFENLAAADCGAVEDLYGATAGLIPGPIDAPFSQDTFGILDSSQARDAFGYALAAGDFNDDGLMDLGVGAPGESFPGAPGAGCVHSIYGTPAGLSAVAPIPSEYFHQNSASVPGTNATRDLMGFALTAADFNGDGADDLAIGVSSDRLGGAAGVGSVITIYGGAVVGLDAAGIVAAQYWHQNIAGIPEINAAGDNFGYSLTHGDYDGNGVVDLCVGIPLEDVGAAPIADAGSMITIYGFPGTGLDAFAPIAAQLWDQDVAGIPGVAVAGELFGWALDR